MMTEWADLPERHRHALLSAKWFGGTMRRGFPPDLFVSSHTAAELDDLVDLGLMRKRLLSYSLTLAGWKLIGNRQLSG